MWQSIIKTGGNKRVDLGGHPEKEWEIERKFTVKTFEICITEGKRFTIVVILL